MFRRTRWWKINETCVKMLASVRFLFGMKGANVVVECLTGPATETVVEHADDIQVDKTVVEPEIQVAETVVEPEIQVDETVVEPEIQVDEIPVANEIQIATCIVVEDVAANLMDGPDLPAGAPSNKRLAEMVRICFFV